MMIYFSQKKLFFCACLILFLAMMCFLLGLMGIAQLFSDVARILFGAFVVLFVISLIWHIVKRKKI